MNLTRTLPMLMLMILFIQIIYRPCNFTPTQKRFQKMHKSQNKSCYPNYFFKELNLPPSITFPTLTSLPQKMAKMLEQVSPFLFPLNLLFFLAINTCDNHTFFLPNQEICATRTSSFSIYQPNIQSQRCLLDLKTLTKNYFSEISLQFPPFSGPKPSILYASVNPPQ